MNAHSGPGGDWIVEGFAELYSLELLKRSKTMSKRRFAKALDGKRARAARVARVDVPEADGDVTAWGVVTLHELDGAIRRASGDAASLDDVMARLSRWREPITPALLRRAVAEVVASPLDGFFRARGIGG
jgi:predicted metalloprotease with PDZ domain